jgi:deoxyribodipyrimidine photolyase-related protein
VGKQRILYIPHDHLNASFGVLRDADPAADAVVLVESARMVTGRHWHKERLFFLLSSARHFAKELQESGFEVHYIQAPTTLEGLEVAKGLVGNLPVFCAEPSSHKQFQQLLEAGLNYVPNDFFLTSRPLFMQWAEKQKTYVMENFYRAQRQRLNILMQSGDPVGGRWNYDADNRLPPPKNYTWPAYLEHPRDEMDALVARQLDYVPTSTWATTRTGALKQLDYFIENSLKGFGPYEDAITKENWALHHSLLSPYLNNGLLHAREVVAAVLKAFEASEAPIESVEAFVRQVIGWREYINGMYWFLG